MSLIRIDKNLCRKNGACVDSCPYSLLTLGRDGHPEAKPGAEDLCVRCGHCVSICPTGALRNTLMEDGVFVELEALDRADPVAFVMRSRRSVRAFLPEAIPKAQLASMLDVARHAPTGQNAQNLWWIVTTGSAQTRPLALLARQWMRRVMDPDRPEEGWPDDDPVLRGAPNLVLCCGPEDSPWGAVDAAIALTHLELLAASRGFGACWAGAFVRAAQAWPPLQEALDLPAGQRLYGALMLGLPRRRHRLVPPRKPLAVQWR